MSLVILSTRIKIARELKSLQTNIKRTLAGSSSESREDRSIRFEKTQEFMDFETPRLSRRRFLAEDLLAKSIIHFQIRHESIIHEKMFFKVPVEHENMLFR